ncbi:putative dehydrogenase [Flavobacteriaceae bacterium MAR_2009_75]|nr:putative dehydrogenase [Flavobacteriaceae bacterium MAR_2009_75]
MKKLRGVCIGAGYFSQFHFEAWQRMKNVEIVGVCDTEVNRAENICKQYGFKKAYSDVTKMFANEKVDFVDIITPPSTHKVLCQLAIDHGIHIICQKPLAPTYEESRLIADTIENSKIRMMVHENFRFQPWHREIKKLLNNHTVGDELLTINLRMRMGDGWQTDAYMNRQPYFREMERLLIYETGIHFIDVFRYLFGELKQVYSILKTLNHNIKGEDFAWVQFEFNNGALGFLDANRYNESTAENPRLTFGTLLIEGNEGSIRLYEDGKITIQNLGEKERLHNYTFEKKNFSGDCVYATQMHFIECLSTGNSFETEVSGYLKNIVIQEAIYKSNTMNAPIPI